MWKHSFRALRAPLLALAAASAMALPAAAGPRVMSLNVCTDQLVLGLAERGQIASLSGLSDDPLFSYHHAAAAGLPKNGGLAEQVLVERPDLVVTGRYSLHRTAPLLRSLGMAVETFDYAQTLDSVPEDIRRMGRLLGAGAEANRQAAAFERELASLTPEPGAPRPRVVVFTQNGVVYGAGTLIDSVVQAAGFANLAAEQGLTGMAPLSLERLLIEAPDLVIVSTPQAEAPALADRIMRHPALTALPRIVTTDVVPPGAWACGGPFTLEAVRALRAERDRLLGNVQG